MKTLTASRRWPPHPLSLSESVSSKFYGILVPRAPASLSRAEYAIEKATVTPGKERKGKEWNMEWKRYGGWWWVEAVWAARLSTALLRPISSS